MKIDEQPWELWLKLSNIHEYEDYDLETHNYLQINSLLKELEWIQKNKQKYPEEELVKNFSEFIENL